MSRFLGVEIQTDVRCAGGARRAWFPATDLLDCQAVLSPTEPETLRVALQRTDDRAAEVLAGRVVRTCFSDTADDREWDIIQLEDTDTDEALALTAQPIALRLGRVLYEAEDGATGAPVVDFTAVGVTASEAITDYVLPPLADRGLTWIAAGTIDPTNRFDLSGQWASVLEIVRAIAAPSAGAAEWQLRRNGDASYLIDLRTQIGSSAGTLRVRTGGNLLAHRRSRSVLEAVTRVFPRGAEVAQQRTMADHLWEVASVAGLEITLAAPDGVSAGPIQYADQLNGLYLASFGSTTFSATLITDSDAVTQKVTVASAAGFSIGDPVRVLASSSANGARLTSLTNPTLAAAPSAGGLGDLGEFYDLPDLRGDCNLIPNPWQRRYSSGSGPADGYYLTAGTPANVTQTRETTIVRDGSPYTHRVQTTGSTTLYRETPDIPFWAIAGRRHFPALWFYIDAVPAAVDSAIVFDLYTAAGVKVAEIGRWVRGGSPATDTWLRIEGAVMDLSALTGKVRIRATLTTTTGGAAASGWNVVFGHAMLAESEIPVEDIEYSGGTVLWQRANARLAAASAAVRGQELRIADLEADDPTTFASLKVTPGQSVELTDTVLGEVTSARVIEYRPDYLRPLASELRVGTAALLSSTDVAGGGLTPAAPVDPNPASEMVAIETSFDENGQLFVRVIGDADTASIYCAVSTSGDPTEATLMQATPSNGRQAEFTFAGPYDLGQTVYVAARGSGAVSGQGGLSDVIRARAVRGNSATSKTIRLPAAGVLKPIDETLIYSLGAGAGYIVATPATNTEGMMGFIPVPKGVTLTGVRMRGRSYDSGGAGSDQALLRVARVGIDGATTSLGSLGLFPGDSTWYTDDVGALSEDTSGDRSYVVFWTFDGDATGSGWTWHSAWIEYDIDVPDLNATT